MSDFVQKTIIQAVDQQSKTMKTIGDNTKKSFYEMGKSAESASKSVLNFKNAVAAFASGKIIGSFIEVERNLVRIDNALTIGTGSAENARKEYAFLQKEAGRLGLELQSTALSYAQLTAAAKNTNLTAEEQRQIFLGVSEAGSALGLSAADMEGALRAVQQMISKGNVQAEELRGQLGERIPGAFSIASKAMGVTEKQMNKLLETGKVTAEELLPLLAKELRSTFGETAQKGPENLNGKINLLKNSMVELQKTILDGGAREALKGTFDGARVAVEKLGDNIGVLTGMAKALFVVWSAKKIMAISKAIKINYIETRVMTQVYQNHQVKMVAATGSQWAFGKALKALSFAGPMIAIAGFQLALDKLIEAQEQAAENNEQLSKSIGGESKESLGQLIQMRVEWDKLVESGKAYTETFSTDFDGEKVSNGKVLTKQAQELINKQSKITKLTFDTAQGRRRTLDLLIKEANIFDVIAKKTEKPSPDKNKTGGDKTTKTKDNVVDFRKVLLQRQKFLNQVEKNDLARAQNTDKLAQEQSEKKAKLAQDALLMQNQIRELEIQAQADSAEKEVLLLKNTLERKRIVEGENADLMTALESETQSKIDKIKEAQAIKDKERQKQIINSVHSQAMRVGNAFAGLAQVQAQNEIKKAEAAGKSEDEIDKIRKRAFEQQKTWQTLTILGNTAVGISNAIARGGIFGLIEGVGITAAGAAQLATVNAQKYAEGGIVGGNQYSGDRVNARLDSGEMVINRRDQKDLFNFIKSQKSGGGGGVTNKIYYQPNNNFSGGGAVIEQLENEPEKFVEFFEKTIQDRGYGVSA